MKFTHPPCDYAQAAKAEISQLTDGWASSVERNRQSRLLNCFVGALLSSYPQKSPISTDGDAKVVREKKEAAQNIVMSVSALRRVGKPRGALTFCSVVRSRKEKRVMSFLSKREDG